MATIEEKRRMLEAKLKEMSEDSVPVRPTKKTCSIDSIDEHEVTSIAQDEITGTEEKRDSTPREQQEMKKELEIRNIESYRSRFFQSSYISQRTSFTANAETLRILRHVLQDLGERVSMVAYIDNILREHLREYQELLNTAAAKQRRKTTIIL